eukprot:scaffold15235_cov61-Phaeocystis_antarctica.AAC.7
MFGGIYHAQALAVLAYRRLSLGGTQRQNWVNIRLADAAARESVQDCGHLSQRHLSQRTRQAEHDEDDGACLRHTGDFSEHEDEPPSTCERAPRD